MTTPIGPSPDPVNDLENMRALIGHTITAAAFLFPAVVLMAVGLTFGNFNTGAGMAFLWIALLLAVSLKFRRKRTFLVVERFGYFWDIKFAGPRLLIPFVDNPVYADDFLQKSIPLFLKAEAGQTNKIEIDFIGASTPVDAAAWYQIGNPEDVERSNRDKLRRQVLAHTYRVKADERATRVADIFQNEFRPRLETRTLAEAQRDMVAIAKDSVEEVRPALEYIGVYPFPSKGITVQDIDLPAVLTELRERELRGEADAKEAINRSRSYWEPLVGMKRGLDGAGIKMSAKAVKELFLVQKGLETVQQTGSNVSFVAPNIDGVMKTITIGSADNKGPKE